MADPEDKEPEPGRSTSPAGARAGGRAARRRVELPGSTGADGSQGSDGGRAPAPGPASGGARRSRSVPFWKQGRFWFAVIVVEVVGALVIASVAENRITSPSVNLDGADIAQFCSLISQDRSLAAVTLSEDVSQLPGDYRAQAQQYRQLEPSAPADLRGDLAQLAESSDAIAEAATAALQANPSGPAAAIAAITQKESAEQSQNAAAEARVAAAVQQACGIDITASPAGTTSGVPAAGSSLPK